jgi:hypothetical protein
VQTIPDELIDAAEIDWFIPAFECPENVLLIIEHDVKATLLASVIPLSAPEKVQPLTTNPAAAD